MKKFILEQLDRWSKANSKAQRAVPSLEEARKEHTVLLAEMMGAQSHMGQFAWNRGALFLTRHSKRLLRNLVEKTTSPCLVLDPRPGLRIIDLNDAYAAATLTNRYRIAGDNFFNVFPDSPENSDADGVANLFQSLRKTAQDGQAHVIDRQRYDMLDIGGHFVECHWQSINTPVLDEKGQVIYLLNRPSLLPSSGLVPAGAKHVTEAER